MELKGLIGFGHPHVYTYTCFYSTLRESQLEDIATSVRVRQHQLLKTVQLPDTI